METIGIGGIQRPKGGRQFFHQVLNALSPWTATPSETPGPTLCLKPHEVSSLWSLLRLMDKILHYFKYPKLWELWYIPYNG